MSMLIGTFQNHMTFEEYTLSESIKPKQTNYGTNPPEFNNKQISKFSNDIISTCFASDNRLYFVQLSVDTGEIGFAKLSKIPKTFEELSTVVFDVEPTKNSFALGIFGEAFYVFLELIKVSDIDSVYFDSANPELGKVYGLTSKNKFFNKTLNQLGWSDLELKDDKFITSKI